MRDRKPVRALSREGLMLVWDFDDYTEAIALEDLLSDLVERIERLEGAYINAQVEIVLPDLPQDH